MITKENHNEKNMHFNGNLTHTSKEVNELFLWEGTKEPCFFYPITQYNHLTSKFYVFHSLVSLNFNGEEWQQQYRALKAIPTVSYNYLCQAGHVIASWPCVCHQLNPKLLRINEDKNSQEDMWEVKHLNHWLPKNLAELWRLQKHHSFMGFALRRFYHIF